MRTIRIKAYKFNELSEEAKQYAINKYRNQTVQNNDYAWQGENIETVKSFCKIFPVELNRRAEGFIFTGEDRIADLTGHRLATYLWNNYRPEIYRPKQYWICTGRKNTVGANAKHRNSNIFIIEDGCPLTGYCLDNAILKPVFDFMRRPDLYTDFKDLMFDCFHAWEEAVKYDQQWQISDEYISETIEANDYEFTADGKMI